MERYQYVGFAGERNNADPNFNPNQKGECWMVIMQHAILQEMGLSTTSPPGGNPYYALPILRGTPSTSTGIAGTADVRAVHRARAARRCMAARSESPCRS